MLSKTIKAFNFCNNKKVINVSSIRISSPSSKKSIFTSSSPSLIKNGIESSNNNTNQLFCNFPLNSNKRFFSDDNSNTTETPPQTPPQTPPEPPKKVIRDIGQIIQCNFKLNQHVKERNFVEAEKLFQHMLAKPELLPNVITYTTMLNSYRKQKDLNKINEILAEMKQKNIKSNDMTYCTLIEAFGKQGELDRMVAFYEEMKQNQYKPDLKTFVIIQESLLKRNDAETQRRVLTEMKKLNVPPNDKCYNYLLESYSRRDEIEPMMKTFDEMKKTGLQPDETTFQTMIAAWYRVNGLEQIANFFDRMKILYVRPMAESFNMYMELLERKGDLEPIPGVYEQISIRKSHPDQKTIQIMTRVLPKLKDIPDDKFLKLVQDIKTSKMKIDIDTYNGLIEIFALRGNKDAMIQTFDQLRSIPRMKLNAQTFNHMITGYGKTGDVAKAIEMVYEMKLKAIKPNTQTYINLLEACKLNNKHELVEGLLKEMRESYKIVPDVNVYQVSLEILGKFGEIKRGLEIIKNMKNEGVLTKNGLKSFYNAIQIENISDAKNKELFVQHRDKLNASDSISNEEVDQIEKFLQELQQ